MTLILQKNYLRILAVIVTRVIICKMPREEERLSREPLLNEIGFYFSFVISEKLVKKLIRTEFDFHIVTV